MFQKKIGKYIFTFPILILILSCLNLYTQFNSQKNYLNIIVSLIGILGSVLYFFKMNFYTKLIYFWAFSQVIILTRYFPDVNNGYIENPIWNTTQVFKVTVEFFLLFKPIYYIFQFNFISLLYIAAAHILYLNSLSGIQIKIRAFKEESFLNSYLPTTATIEKRITLSDEKNWLLIKLNEKTMEEINYALIKPKDDGILKLKKKSQMIFFLLVPDVNIFDGKYSRKDFTSGDWAVIGG